MRNLPIVLMAGVISAPCARSAEIILNGLANAAEQSALVGTCTYEKTDAIIRCQTSQISVSYALDPEKFDKTWKAESAQLDAEFKTDSDVEDFCKKRLFDYGQGGVMQQQLEKALKRPTSEQGIAIAITGAVTLQGAAELLETCKHPTRSNLREWYYNRALAETKQCQIKTSQLATDVLKKVSDTKWISSYEPSGICHVVTVTTLERHDRKSQLWTWMDVTSTMDNDAFCRKSGITLNAPLVFSWNSGPFPMRCETINLRE